MTAIGKHFIHHDEHFVVAMLGINHFICVSLRDKRAWRFGFDELRSILNAR